MTLTSVPVYARRRAAEARTDEIIMAIGTVLAMMIITCCCLIGKLALDSNIGTSYSLPNITGYCCLATITTLVSGVQSIQIPVLDLYVSQELMNVYCIRRTITHNIMSAARVQTHK